MKLFYKILLTTNLHLVTQSIKVLRNTNHEILQIEGTIKLVELLLLIFVMVTPKVALIKNYLKYNRGRNYISNPFLRLFLGLIIREGYKVRHFYRPLPSPQVSNKKSYFVTFLVLPLIVLFSLQKETDWTFCPETCHCTWSGGKRTAECQVNIFVWIFNNEHLIGVQI